MRVFVTGTGRCGTTTFKEACRHMTNYTAGHETHRHRADFGRLEYPDNHIEVDPHLWAMLPLLYLKYPDSHFVHMRRDKGEVTDSWWRREQFQQGRGQGLAALAAPFVQLAPTALRHEPSFKKAASLMYDVMTENIDYFMRTTSCPIYVFWLNRVEEWMWREFWDRIGAEGDFGASFKTWESRFNAS